MREDTNTHGLRQWYYFQVKCRRSMRLRLRIFKFSKRFSLYRLGMKPYVKTWESEWKQDGEKIRYDYDADFRSYYLEFEYSFEANQETFFATLPPYTYSRLSDYLSSLEHRDNVTISKIGVSLGGLDIMAIRIVDPSPAHSASPVIHEDRNEEE